MILIIVIIASNSFKNCTSGTSEGSESGTAKAPDTNNIVIPPESGEETTAPDTEAPSPLKTTKIYIDPGHGFGDVGSNSEYLTGYNESGITLLVAQEVVGILRDMGCDAYLTHNGKDFPRSSVDDGNDLFSALDERPTFINENGGGLVVSLHCDAFESDTVSGTRVHYCDDYAFGTTSADLADKLGNAINKAVGSERCKKSYPHSGTDAYNITRLVNAPAALIEMGFISNSEDAALLLDPAWRTKLATGIANGIVEFLTNYEPPAE